MEKMAALVGPDQLGAPSDDVKTAAAGAITDPFDAVLFGGGEVNNGMIN
jgi:hypothetical protein